VDRIDRWLGAAAALLGALGVAGGAFAAHALQGDPRAAALMGTAASYQLVHVLAALLALGRGRPGRAAALLLLVGCALFSGSLAAMALGAPRWLGAVAPVGGTAFILGWLALARAWLARR
jgi:uncharacterized membrane protein YgdD (TMEM256/DUF423 family)